MADAFFALLLFYSFVFGARRGFYKEVVQTVALVVAIYLAYAFRNTGGAALAEATGLPAMLAQVGAVVAIWVTSFFVVAVVGRLLLKQIRGDGVDEHLGEGAEAVADAIAGDTTKGPVTLLTDPIASKRGLYYWSDKILGSGLGLLKGVVTGYVVLGLFIYADRARGWDSAFARSIETSYAARAFHEGIEPYLQSYPEYRIARSLGQVQDVAEAVKQDPRRFDAFADHPELRSLKNHPRLEELAKDPEVRKAWEARDLKGLLLHEKVRELLGDRELRERVAHIDWAKVLADVKGASGAGSSR